MSVRVLQIRLQQWVEENEEQLPSLVLPEVANLSKTLLHKRCPLLRLPLGSVYMPLGGRIIQDVPLRRNSKKSRAEWTTMGDMLNK